MAMTKTRLMLGRDKNGIPYTGMLNTMGRIYSDEGAKALFSGLVPRLSWISMGGAVFLGCYEHTKHNLMDAL